MSIMSCNVKIIGRASRADAHQTRSPRSVTGAAAYRAGTLIVDSRTGTVHDYRRKQGVDQFQILVPDNAPAWAHDRSALWNAVEQIEKRKDAQLAREVMVAIPRELSRERCTQLVSEWTSCEFVARGMVADICFHKIGSQNPHAHILLTLRPIGTSGFGQKNREWNDRALVEYWRASWAKACNRALAEIGSDSKLDHRSYQRQGLPIEPTHHLGPLASAMEARGVATELGNLNRSILQRRSLWRLLVQESGRLLRELHKTTNELASLQQRRSRSAEAFTRAWQRINQTKAPASSDVDAVHPVSTLCPKI